MRLTWTPDKINAIKKYLAEEEKSISDELDPFSEDFKLVQGKVHWKDSEVVGDPVQRERLAKEMFFDE